jgi:hypothetical protein
MSTTTIARRLQASLSTMTGVRSAGVATATATGAPVEIAKGEVLLPVRASATGAKQIDWQSPVWTTADVTVAATPTAIPVRSVFGGLRFNFPLGTELLFERRLQGTTRPVVTTAMTGGLSSVSSCGIKRLVFMEGLSPRASMELFLAQVGDFPAAVLAWDGSGSGEPAGRAAIATTERWAIFVVAARTDDALARGFEGLAILDRARHLLINRSHVEGLGLSGPGVRIRGRRRLALSPQHFIYVLDIETSGRVERDDERDQPGGTPLDMRDIVSISAPVDEVSNAPDFLIVNDVRVDMDPEEAPP